MSLERTHMIRMKHVRPLEMQDCVVRPVGMEEGYTDLACKNNILVDS